MKDKHIENEITEISRGFLEELAHEAPCDIPDMRQAILQAQTAVRPQESSSMEYELACMHRAEIVYMPKITAFHSRTARLIVMVKKVICKACKFWGEPLTDQINVYHDHVYYALCAANERLNQLEDEKRQLAQQVKDLQEQMRALKEKP